MNRNESYLVYFGVSKLNIQHRHKHTVILVDRFFEKDGGLTYEFIMIKPNLQFEVITSGSAIIFITIIESGYFSQKKLYQIL